MDFKQKELPKINFKLDDVVNCQPCGNIKNAFKGIVEKVYTRSILVKIMEHHPDDRWEVIKLTEKTVIAADKISN
ncbi:hypothetical protein LOSG293_210340 [Secundilactobacillus oryzae JCM 18671]|uniref:Uncharacterized protein n=1 Tax=Secundilactobacillus oryzae JCM 18671 TaxID=1291743 RepID=A0A081BJJ2_9LACO|nr:hypothetical protein [Secundilactobacillus oryzae]GAK48210.1 hypothetical protein LOSG293_210340 [Secundilactobacillus oryzae JCM 18671]